VLVVAVDISNEKRRQVLERIFFHDLLNTAGSIYGIVQLMTSDPAAAADLKGDLASAAETLVAEIKSQRLLLAAENNDLQTSPGPVHTGAMLDSVVQVFRNHEVAAGKRILLPPDRTDLVIRTDESLLLRVLGNLLKNALEATTAGGTVRVGLRPTTGGVVFWCWNDAAIPSETKWQVFQRNFSTKGRGRGLGTYSVRLLAERYLHGRVGFTSSPEHGTQFEIFLPTD
jgi:signal transduction histidine kinase